jgi:geranylgeranyl pyrophosphate synthase
MRYWSIAILAATVVIVISFRVSAQSKSNEMARLFSNLPDEYWDMTQEERKPIVKRVFDLQNEKTAALILKYM